MLYRNKRGSVGESFCGWCWGDSMLGMSLTLLLNGEAAALFAALFQKSSVLLCFMRKNKTISIVLRLTGLFHGWTSTGSSTSFYILNWVISIHKGNTEGCWQCSLQKRHFLDRVVLAPGETHCRTTSSGCPYPESTVIGWGWELVSSKSSFQTHPSRWWGLKLSKLIHTVIERHVWL